MIPAKRFRFRHRFGVPENIRRDGTLGLRHEGRLLRRLCPNEFFSDDGLVAVCSPATCSGNSTPKFTCSVNTRNPCIFLCYPDHGPAVRVLTGSAETSLISPQAAEVLVDHFDLLLTAGIFKADYTNAPTPNPRSIIIDTVAAQSDTLLTGKALTAPYLIITSPAFNVQR